MLRCNFWPPTKPQPIQLNCFYAGNRGLNKMEHNGFWLVSSNNKKGTILYVDCNFKVSYLTCIFVPFVLVFGALLTVYLPPLPSISTSCSYSTRFMNAPLAEHSLIFHFGSRLKWAFLCFNTRKTVPHHTACNAS